MINKTYEQPKVISFGYLLMLKFSFLCMSLLWLFFTFTDYTFIKLHQIIYEAIEKWMYQLGEMSGDTQEIV